MPYKNIYVPLDGSELSHAAARMAIDIAASAPARITGSHVYAARLHDRRFRAMESGLPREYREEEELERQRTVHRSLIAKGLELISESYLVLLQDACREKDVPFRGISLEGKNWKELVEDIQARDYDLVVLGGHGVGRVETSLLGSVAERVLRRVKRDVLICKREQPRDQSDCIVVCLDGSGRSWGALRRGMDLAKTFQKKLVALSVFDPYFHYTMFSMIKNVLTEKASAVFKFEEQEKLHETIIDSGLAKVYQAHLDIAKRVCGEENMAIETHLLDGKAYAEILKYCRKNPPWLLLLGRIGIHSEEGMDLGGNTENISRLANCNLLVVNLKSNVPVELQAEETVAWTKEAKAGMAMVPSMARGVAMKAVQNFCIAEGYTVITTSVLNAAVKSILPPEAIARMGIRFEDSEIGLEGEKKKAGMGFQCPDCGYYHQGRRPLKCPVCGTRGSRFLSVEDRSPQGGVTQKGLDDRQLIWEKASLEALESIENPVLRNQIRTRLEKRALSQKRSAVTLAMLRQCLPEPHPPEPTPAKVRGENIVWTDAAWKRLERVPEGFMRKAAAKTVETFAEESGMTEITFETAEKGLARAREKMADALGKGHPGIKIARSSG